LKPLIHSESSASSHSPPPFGSSSVKEGEAVQVGKVDKVVKVVIGAVVEETTKEDGLVANLLKLLLPILQLQLRPPMWNQPLLVPRMSHLLRLPLPRNPLLLVLQTSLPNTLNQLRYPITCRCMHRTRHLHKMDLRQTLMAQSGLR
jgi:hypothetical protein